eukprot:g48001.t1
MVKDTSSIPGVQESQGAEVSVAAITKEKVLGKLKGLQVDKSPGPNGLHARLPKEIVTPGPLACKGSRHVEYALAGTWNEIKVACVPVSLPLLLMTNGEHDEKVCAYIQLTLRGLGLAPH